MTTIEVTFKNPIRQPIQGVLEISPENSDAISVDGVDVFVNKTVPPVSLSFGSAVFELLSGRYIFSLRDTTGTLISSFSAFVPETDEVVYLADLIKNVFPGGGLALATKDSPGVIQVGEGLEISDDGVLSVSRIEVDAAIAEKLGVQSETRIYVNPKAPPHHDAYENNGQSPVIPFRTLQRALLQASLSEEPVTIDLAPGEYWVDNRPGKKISDLVALRQNQEEFVKITDIPRDYGRYQDASNLIKKNSAWIVSQAYAIVQQRLVSDAITLTPNQSKRCRTDLGLITKGIAEDISEMGNQHSVCSARSYRTNRMVLRYLTQSQITAFNLGLDSILANCLLAITNQAPYSDDSIIVDTEASNPSNYCSNVQSTINSLVGIIKSSLAGTVNPWTLEITRGIFPNLHWFNPPRFILDQNSNEVNEEIWGFYRDSATLISNAKDSLVLTAYNSIQSSVPIEKKTKCQRDIGYVVDALIEDLRVIGNQNILKVARLYKNIEGEYYVKPDGGFVLLEQERILMADALQTLRTNVSAAILNDFADPTDYTPSEADPTVVTAFAQGLIDIVRNTLISPYNPWADTPIDKGVQVLSGGIVVPNGTTFATVGLRRPIIRPLYIAEEDVEFGTIASIFKLTSEVFSYGFTYKDTPGANFSHHKVFCTTFASDDIELNPAHESYYYGKVGALFYDNPLYFAFAELGTEIVGSANDGDRFQVDTVKGASPYIYNCSVRSEWGLNGMWADGARVTGFKSMVTAQFTVVSVQRDREAWQKWDAEIKSWIDLIGADNFYAMKPAYYIDYLHGIADAEKEPENGSIRIKPSWRHTGFTGSNDAFIQIVSCFCIGTAQSYSVDSGADFSITNSNTNFGEIALVANGFKKRSFFVDSGFDLVGVIPPKPLTSSDIVRYEIGVFDAATTWDYFQETGSRDRVYVANGFKLPSVFTLKNTTKIYLFYAGNEYACDVVALDLTGTANALDTDRGVFYVQVDPDANSIFPDGADFNQVLSLQASAINIKRVADRRKTEERVYQFLLESSDAQKRRPPVGFVFNTGNSAVTDSSKVYWVYESKSVEGSPGLFSVICLGLEADGTANEQNKLITLSLEDYDEEPVFDPSTLEILVPDYNPDRSITKIIAKGLFAVDDVGYRPLSVDWINPSNSVAQIENIGFDTGGAATVQFHRPSQIRCSGHTFEYSGFPNYSHGLPQFQQITLPVEAKLSKNRKNVEGGIVFYDGLDDEGNVWTGNSRLNLSSGAEEVVDFVDTPVPPIPVDFDTLSVQTRIIVGDSLEINSNSVVIPFGGFISLAGKRIFSSQTPPSTGSYLVGDIILNSLPSEGEPFAWRLISNSPALEWEAVDGYEQKQKVITELLSVPSGSQLLVAGNVNIFPVDLQGNINNVNIGNLVRGTGAFTTLDANGVVTLNPTNANISIVPTGTGTVLINPESATGEINNVNVGSSVPRTGTFTSLNATTNVNLSPSLVSNINNVNIGATTRGTGAFTTLSASGVVTLNPSNANVSIAPTGTGTVLINPATVGNLDNVAIGSVTPRSGVFATLTAGGTATLNPSNANVSIAPTGTGSVTINPATAGNINNVNIGATTRGTGAFTTLDANGVVTLNPTNANISIAPTGTGILTINSGGVGSINNVAIGGTNPRSGTFTNLTATGATSLQNLNVATNAVISGDVTITGNLTISGSQTQVDTISTTVSDPMLNLGAGVGGAVLIANDGNDRGIVTTYYDSQQRQSFFGFINPSREFRYYEQISLSSPNKIDTSSSILGDAVFGLVTAGLTVPVGSTLTVNGAFNVSPSPAGAINNVAIGSVTPRSGVFTTLTAGGTVALSPSSANVSIAPTGTGSVTINPATAGNINNVNIGATTRGTGSFTTLNANGAVALNPNNSSVSITPTGTGILTLSSGAVGSLNNVNIGVTTPGTGAFTTLSVGGTSLLSSGTITRSLLPIATSTLLGAVTVGGGLSVNGSGNVTARQSVLQVASLSVPSQNLVASGSAVFNLLTGIPANSVIQYLEVVIPAGAAPGNTTVIEVGEPLTPTKYAQSTDVDVTLTDNFLIYPFSKKTTESTVQVRVRNTDGANAATSPAFEIYAYYSTLTNFVS